MVDFVYAQGSTELLACAREQGVPTLDGLELLVAQGALSLELWTGRPAPLEVMRRAAGRRQPVTEPSRAGGCHERPPLDESPDLHEIFGMDLSRSARLWSRCPARAAGVEAEVITEEAGVPGASRTRPPACGRPPKNEPEGRPGITSPSRRGSSSRFLTDVIVDMGLVAREQRGRRDRDLAQPGDDARAGAVEGGTLTHDGLARALAERYGLDHLDLGVFPVDMSAANLVTTAAAKRYQAVPVAFVDKRTLLVAMTDPSNVLAVDDIAIMTGYEVRVAVAAPEDIAALISRLDRLDDVVAASGELASEEAQAEVVELHETDDDAPVIKLVPDRRAGGGAGSLRRAPRPDGKETARALPCRRGVAGHHHVPRKMGRGSISRVKIMAELDISERRLPQDGALG